MVLPGGASYKVLVLPTARPMNPDNLPLSPEAQAKVEELRAAGVIIPQLLIGKMIFLLSVWNGMYFFLLMWHILIGAGKSMRFILWLIRWTVCVHSTLLSALQGALLNCGMR